jgi:hypothetical protein
MINIFTSQLALKNLQLSLLWKFDGSCILFSSFLVYIFLCFIINSNLPNKKCEDGFEKFIK